MTNLLDVGCLLSDALTGPSFDPLPQDTPQVADMVPSRHLEPGSLPRHTWLTGGLVTSE